MRLEIREWTNVMREEEQSSNSVSSGKWLFNGVHHWQVLTYCWICIWTAGKDKINLPPYLKSIANLQPVIQCRNNAKMVITTCVWCFVECWLGYQVLGVKQESCAIAKMITQCALHMSALKIFGTPWLRPYGHYSQHFHGLLFRSTLWMFLQNLKSIALPDPDIIGGTPKICAVPGYAHAPFSPKFWMGFYLDWPCKCTRQI